MSYIGTEPKDIRSFGRTKFDYTASQGQTAFTGADDDGKVLAFTTGQINVYVNGILMDDSDFTTTGTGTVTLASAANLNDVVNIVSFESNIPDNDYVPASGGTFTGAVTASNGLTVDDDGATVLTVDRATSDGTIIDVQKDGTSVGSIRSLSGDITIDGPSEHTGLRFEAADITPRHNGALSNNYTSLGTASSRYKDLFLGGGLYLGGTGAANKLDDYEEGTWTATLNSPPSGITNAASTSSLNRYTKIGNIVFIQGVLSITDDSSGSAISLNGLPFTSASGTGAGGGHIERYGSTTNFNPYIGGSSNRVEFYSSSNTGNWNAVQYSEVGSWYVHFNVYYSTDA